MNTSPEFSVFLQIKLNIYVSPQTEVIAMMLVIPSIINYKVQGVFNMTSEKRKNL